MHSYTCQYMFVQAPTVDGVELTQPLIHQSTQHPNKDVPVLAGANLDEGTEFMGDTPVRGLLVIEPCLTLDPFVETRSCV